MHEEQRVITVLFADLVGSNGPIGSGRRVE
jgi:hypothetical protein